MIEFIALILGVLTTFLITLAVFTKNRHSITNQLFVALALSLIGWSVTTYFSLHTQNDQQTLTWIRWIMFFVVSQNTSFFLLVQVFPDYQSRYVHTKWFKIAVAYSALVAAVAVSPFLFASFSDGAPQPGPGMALFMPHALIFAAGGVTALFIKYRKSRGLKRTQLRYFLAGTLLLFTVEPLGNFVLPIIFGNNDFVRLSPLYAIVFSGLIAYAILTQKLFDMRAAVARSVAYVLVTVTMVGLYAAGLFGVINVFFGGTDKETLRQILSILILMPLAVSFQYLKSFFDRVTGRLFYKENYNFQDVLDKVGAVVATETNLNKLLDKTQKVLSSALNASFMEYALVKGEEPTFLLSKRFAPYADSLGEHLSAQQRILLITEEMDTGNPLWRPFEDAQIALSLRLRTQKEVIGYILIGHKKNGESYSTQDHHLLDRGTSHVERVRRVVEGGDGHVGDGERLSVHGGVSFRLMGVWTIQKLRTVLTP